MRQCHASAMICLRAGGIAGHAAAIRPYPLMLHCNMTAKLMLLCVTRIAGMSFYALLNPAASAYIRVNKNGDQEIGRQFDRNQIEFEGHPKMAMNIIASYKNWRKFRETYNELSRLSSRELADLGIHRGEIERVAKQAVGY
ncbi:DUF1127 domain-containing protein [Kaistia granuli]|uniref:DUF1127 domain-containing protein n=1 Tax=Kaistia granuli TaxID=363259 RepID=UPI003CCB9B9D